MKKAIRKLVSWPAPFRNVRTRFLVWYFLLTVATTTSVLLVTRQIYCNRLDAKAEASLVEEVERFERMAIQTSDIEVDDLFDQFLTDYVPVQNEMVVTAIDGQLYKASQPLPDWLQDNSSLIAQWASFRTQHRQQVANPDQRLFYIVEP